MAVLDKTSSWYSLRGKVGSLIVSSNAQSSYVRGARPPNPRRTQAQTDNRAAFSQIMGQWRLLSDNDQQAWRTAAALPEWQRYDWYGQPYNMSGPNLFCAVNRLTLACYGTFVLTPPATPAPTITPPSTWSWTFSPGASITWSCPRVNWQAEVAAVRLMALARYWSTQRIATTVPRLVLYSQFADTDPANITFLLSTIFGPPPVQSRWFFNVTSISADGRLGPTLSYDLVVQP